MPVTETYLVGNGNAIEYRSDMPHSQSMKGLTVMDEQGTAELKLSIRVRVTGHIVVRGRFFCHAMRVERSLKSVAPARDACVLRRLKCSVCGGEAGRHLQHWNQDDGWGVCRSCFDRLAAKGYTVAELTFLYWG